MQSVNFLAQRVRLQEELLSRDKRVAFFTAIALGVFLSIVIGVFGYQAFLAKQASELAQAVEDSKQQLAMLGKKQARIQERSTKLRTVRTIIDNRGKNWAAIEYFYKLLPTEATISGINVSMENGTVQFSIHSPTIFVYETVVATLQSSTVKDNGYRVELGDLTRDKTGAYELSVSLAIISGKQAPSPSI